MTELPTELVSFFCFLLGVTAGAMSHVAGEIFMYLHEWNKYLTKETNNEKSDSI